MASYSKIRLPWFRVHVVVLNDPGRLISVHIMHTGLCAGWSGLITLYEIIIFDPTDPVFNPMWRQSCYVIPCSVRLGVVSSIYRWSLGIELAPRLYWTYETVGVAHIALSHLSILAAFWHWAYWDLDLFITRTTSRLALDLNRIFGIHLVAAAVLCLGFGIGHLSGFAGPGMWTADSFALLGSVRFVKPVYEVIRLAPFSYGVITANHISAGLLSIFVGLWHIESRGGPLLYKLLRMGNIEGSLSSSIVVCAYAALGLSALSWYSSVSTPVELFGPSRYQWDNAYFAGDIISRVTNFGATTSTDKAWENLCEKSSLYDYGPSAPSKGGLFRSGPMILGDGLLAYWLGHPCFEMGVTSLACRRMPAFFETFPVILIDKGGQLSADIPFRRAECRYSIEQRGLTLGLAGGALSRREYSTPSVVKNYARKAVCGEMFAFDRKTVSADSTFRTSQRGWFSFSHTVLSLLFQFGHLWHGGRALFKDRATGVYIESTSAVEYGLNEKLGDSTTGTSAFL